MDREIFNANGALGCERVWIAKDFNGTIYVYENQPEWDHSEWTADGSVIYLGGYSLSGFEMKVTDDPKLVNIYVTGQLVLEVEEVDVVKETTGVVEAVEPKTSIEAVHEQLNELLAQAEARLDEEKATVLEACERRDKADRDVTYLTKALQYLGHV